MNEDIGIDWSTDTYDEGMHLNVYGAEKLTKYFGEILKESHGFESRHGDESVSQLWNKHLLVYKERKASMEETEK